MWTLLFQALLLVIVTTFIEAYNKRCPHSSQRTLRGRFVCTGSPIYYSCLFDTNRNDFMEYCNISPDFSAPAEYYVFTGSRRNIECIKTTYQPYSLWSNESSTCIFIKSLCIQIGQTLYKLGSAAEETQCRCDYTKQYAFVVPPLNRCSCTPSEEDCSCYIKQCGSGYILNADYQCELQYQMSETKCKAIENPGINKEKKTELGNYSNPTSFPTLYIYGKGASLVMTLISVVLIILTALCLLVCSCGQRKVPTMNQAEIDKTTNIEDFKVVAAIDIGSRSSWFASSTTDMFKSDPLDIRIDQSWRVSRSTHFSTKTATCILMKKDGSLKLIGHEAQEKYIDIIQNEKADNYVFFENFKMELYNNQNISNEMLIKDVNGTEMKAVDVFSLFIYELMKLVQQSYQGFELNDIQWVLTVPSVWSDKAKAFMRHCVEKNEVKGDRLIIALEPDAVSVYFQYLHTEKPTVVPELEKRYIVVDIGGGTVDITAHEKTDDEVLIELHKSTGNGIGGSEVDTEFLALFRQILNDRVMNSFSTDDKYTDSYFDFKREIEKIKMDMNASTHTKLRFRIPFSYLNTLCSEFNNKSLSETVASSEYSQQISLKGDFIFFRRSLLSLLFKPVGDRISTEIRQMTEKLKDLQIRMILLAGGLSKSALIVKIIEESFKSLKIIHLPEEYPPDLAVVLGAVLYGHRPHFISSRITEYTYGRAVQPTFESGNHDPKKLINVNGTDLCRDVFEVLVEKNTRVKINHHIQKEYKRTSKSQKRIRIAVYTTKKDKVDYVDDAECQLYCEILVPLSESSSKKIRIIVDFVFGYTEFHVTAFDKETKEKYDVSVELK